MKTREEIRMQFFTENNGAYWTNSQEEPDIDYVHWLEDKLINKLTIPVVSNSALIDYIENDAEIAIPIDELMHEDGRHLTKKEYGKVLLKYLVKELREHYC